MTPTQQKARLYYLENRERILANAKTRPLAPGRREYEKAWRASHKADQAGKKATWYQAHREAELEKRRQSYLCNAAKRKQQAKEWAAKNPEKRREHKDRWRVANPDLTHLYRSIRRAQEWGVEHAPYSRTEVFSLHQGICHLCGLGIDADLKWPNTGSYTVDHVIPVSLGGDDVLENVAPAHLGCNASKSNRV